MSETAVHPTYQHRYVDDDGLSLIVSERDLGDLVRERRNLLFGYWRPHSFTQLASLAMADDGAMLNGIPGDRSISASRYDGDPDVLVTEWLAHARAAKTMDINDREAAIARREARDAAYRTRHMRGPFDGGAVNQTPAAIRWALQMKGELVNGTWEGSALVRQVASLLWREDKSVILTAKGRELVFQPPVDLDALAGAWMTFVASAREDMEFDDAMAVIRSSASRHTATDAAKVECRGADMPVRASLGVIPSPDA